MSAGICCYCGVRPGTTGDHIFPVFLGGRRQIGACRFCNNTFGHSFEAAAAQILTPIHVFLAAWGLPLRPVSGVLSKAFERDGKIYDVITTKGGVKPELSRAVPHITRDKNGAIVGRVFGSSDRRRAVRWARQILSSGKATHVEMTEPPIATMEPAELKLQLTVGPDLKRLALKIGVAVASLCSPLSLAKIPLAQDYLSRTDAVVPIVMPVFGSYTALEALRNPLSHLIYVESGPTGLYAVAQFFGVVQLYCKLGTPVQSKAAALVGTLDPLSGAENFIETKALGLPEPPFSMPEAHAVQGIQAWILKFREEAIARGATSPPNFTANTVTVTKPRPNSC